MSRQHIAARSHPSRAGAHGKGIPERINLHLHFCYRNFYALNFNGTARNAQRTFNARCRERSLHMQAALRLSERPFHTIGEHRQQREIGVVERQREIDLLVGAERFAALRRQGAHGQFSMGTCRIGNTVDRFFHRKAAEFNDGAAQLCRSRQLVKGGTANAAVHCREIHIHLGTLRIAPDMHYGRRRSRHLVGDACETGEHAKRNIRRCDVHVRRAVKISRPRSGERSASLFPRERLDRQYMVDI